MKKFSRVHSRGFPDTYRGVSGKRYHTPWFRSGINKLFASVVMGVLISAFAIVYVKDLNRRLAIQQQELQQAHVRLLVEWSKLLIYRSDFSKQARIEKLAVKKFNMYVPRAKDIVLIGSHS